MDRIDFVAGMIIEHGSITSVLDVGCRESELANRLPDSIIYVGSDLRQNRAGLVTYIGDIATISIREQYDCVCALDILEHLDAPSATLRKLLSLSSDLTIISLPNCYDIKCRWRYAKHGRLGGKYRFEYPEPLDRHRWVMGVQEIEVFLKAVSAETNRHVEFYYLNYDPDKAASLRARIAALICRWLPPNLSVHTVVACLSAPRADDRPK